MKKKTTILWVGDGGVATGFARVNHSIINNLPKGKYDVHHLAVNYRGDPFPEAEAPLYPAYLGGDLYGINRLEPMIEKLKPELVFILNDSWLLYQYLSKIPEDIKVVVYFPVDAKPLDRTWCEAIAEQAFPVAYTQYGKSAITDIIPDAEVHVIPHGIDTGIFFPIPVEEARTKLQGITNEDFVILNASRNQPRKRIDLTIKGFAKFAAGKPPHVKLYCHMGVEDMGWNIITMCKRYGIAERLLITSLNLGPSSFVDDEKLNHIYNSCDIGLNTSMGEGWGLTAFEQGACRRAQVVPDNSVHREIYGDSVQLIPIDHTETYPNILTEGEVVSEDGVAETLEYMYTHPEERACKADEVYNLITQPKYQWKNVAKLWDAFFEQVLAI